MTQSTSGRHHWLDGWLPRVTLGLALFLALTPTVPFAGRLPAVLVIGVFSYQLGQRRVERMIEDQQRAASERAYADDAALAEGASSD